MTRLRLTSLRHRRIIGVWTILVCSWSIVTAPTLAQATSNADMIRIDNGNLERYLIQVGADPGPVDGLVPRAGILMVTTLDLANNRIEYLHQVNEFKNLETLIISGNTVAERLEIENLPRLRNIDARNTKLETFSAYSVPSLVSIDLSGNVNLENLGVHSPVLETLRVSPLAEIYGLHLTHTPAGVLPELLASGKTGFLSLGGIKQDSLDTSRLLQLQRLSITESTLTSIDVSRNPLLQELTITNSRLTSIALGSPVMLSSLNLSGNRLRMVDLSGAPGLRYLDVRANQIRRIDLSANRFLVQLNVSGNPLRRLDMSGMSSLTSLDISYTRIGRVDLRSTRLIENNNGFTSFGTRARVIVSNARLARVLWTTQTDRLVTFVSR